MRKATLFNMTRHITHFMLVLVITISSLSNISAQDDCPPLTVFCQDLHTSFMADACMVEVWAKDFVSKINDAQTSLDSFDISFEEDSVVMNRIFESMFGDTYEVSIWITSRCDTSLKTRCIVNLDINDNTGNCRVTPCPADPNPWCGFSVVTCSSSTGSGLVGRVIDVRKNSQAPRGDDWADPNTAATAVNFLNPDDWTLNGIGQIFGTALDATTGDIFLAASDVYAYDFKNSGFTSAFPPPTCPGPAGAAGIYTANFNSLNTTDILVSTRVTYPSAAVFNQAIIGSNLIPNTGNDVDCSPATLDGRDRLGNGIGNIAFDNNSGHLFASNLEDGKIYSIKVSDKTITAVFDPLNPYVHSAGLVTQGERVWGLQVEDCGAQSRLYFSVESTSNTLVKNKTIYSVALNASGEFVGTEQEEFVVAMGMQSKITDIAFSADCDKLLIAERGHPHKSTVLEYQNSNGTWFFVRQYFVGIFDIDAPSQPQGNILGTSSTGGVSYGPQESNCILDNQCDSIVWATINCGDIIADSTRCAIYGLEGISASGNELETNGTTDIFVDFNPTFIGGPSLLKGGIGDVDLFNCCCPGFEQRDTLSTTTVRLAGSISTPSNIPLNKAAVSLKSSKMADLINTNESGKYAFANIPDNDNYFIAPSFEMNPIDGISTLDLLQIQRHILGLRSFESAHQYIAADVNNSNTITVSDIVELRQLLLGNISNFKSNKEWNFIPSSDINSIPMTRINDEASNSIFINHPNSDLMENDFIAVKTGDINNDNSIEAPAGSRSIVERLITWQKVPSFSDGESFGQVDISVETAQSIVGFQVAVSVNNGNALTVESDLEGFGPANFNILDDQVLISWSSNVTLNVSPGTSLFTIVTDSPDSDINLSDTYLSSEIYNADLTSERLALEAKNTIQSGAKLDIIPNPLSDVGYIEFSLSKPMKATIELLGLDGKLIFTRSGNYVPGKNRVKIAAEQVNIKDSGVYIARMITEDGILSQKFLVLK